MDDVDRVYQDEEWADRESTLTRERDKARQRAERAEAVARDVRHEINRQLTLGEVPQLRQIEFWRNQLDAALGADPLLAEAGGEE